MFLPTFLLNLAKSSETAYSLESKITVTSNNKGEKLKMSFFISAN